MRVAYGVLLAALLAACREKLEEVERPYRERLEARLAEVERIGAALARLPPLERDDETIAIAPYGGGIGRFAEHFAFMYAEAFADLSEHGPGPAPSVRLSGANPFTDCASLLRKRRCPAGSGVCSCEHKALTRLYEHCLSLRYVFVIRTLEYGEPGQIVRTTPDLGVPDQGRAREASPARTVQVDAGAPASAPARDAGAGARAEVPPDARAHDLPPPDRGRDRRVESFEFKGGLLRAEIHVYELAGAKRLGGFRLEVRSPASLESHYPLGSTVSAAATSGIPRSNFHSLVRSAIEAQVRARIPNAVVRAR